MIDILLFVPACFALNLAFGPNNLMAMTHGAQMGVRFAVIAGLGRLAVFVPMIAASALGLGILLSASAVVFTAVKLVGAAYLIWLGIRLLRSSVKADVEVPSQRSLSRAIRAEALVAISNPKAILIFAAFFPQFVVVDAYVSSFAVLGAIFIGLEAIAIAVYAAAGRYAARFAATRLHWFQRVSGVGMIGFGVLLLFSPQPASVRS